MQIFGENASFLIKTQTSICIMKTWSNVSTKNKKKTPNRN